MKQSIIKISLLIIIFLAPCTSPLLAQDDAIILMAKENTSYIKSHNKGLNEYRKIKTVHRQIKILSQYGLERYNTLYIPTFNINSESAPPKNLIAKTIKQNGNKINVKPDRIKTTTLPANYPFLFGYKGKVLQLAFENIEIGDIIEYKYTVETIERNERSYFHEEDIIFISEEIPVNKCSYSFVIDEALRAKFHTQNLSKTFSIEKGKEDIFTLEVSNLKPSNNFEYTNQYNENPYFYLVIDDDQAGYSSWTSYLNSQIGYSTNRSYILGGKRIRDLAQNIDKDMLPKQKLKILKDEIESTYGKDPKNAFDIYNDYSVSLNDIADLNKLFHKIGLNARVVLLRNNMAGEVIESLYSASQFEQLAIEYTDEKGKNHYWSIFQPYSQFDELPTSFQGVNALRISYQGRDYTGELVELPDYAFEKNSTSANIDLTIIDQYRLKGNASYQLTGNYSQSLRPIVLLQESYSDKDIFNRFYSIVFSTPSDFERDSVSCSSTGVYDSLFVNFKFSSTYNKFSDSKTVSLKLKKLFETERLKLPIPHHKLTSAYISEAPKVDNYQFTITAPDNGKLVQNDLLNYKKTWDIGSIDCTSKLIEDKLVINFTLKLNTQDISESHMTQFRELTYGLESLMEQYIPIQF